MKPNAVAFKLSVVEVPGGYASRCWLEGELIGQRDTFPTFEQAQADQEVAEAQIAGDLKARGIVAVKRGGAQA